MAAFLDIAVSLRIEGGREQPRARHSWTQIRGWFHDEAATAALAPDSFSGLRLWGAGDAAVVDAGRSHGPPAAPSPIGRAATRQELRGVRRNPKAEGSAIEPQAGPGATIWHRLVLALPRSRPPARRRSRYP